MHFAREGYPRIFGLGILCLVLNLLGFTKLGFVFLLLTFFVAYFFRDPERVAPEDDRYLIAPADGRVVTIEQNVTNERWLTDPATRVGIFMSPLDVHVNRAPLGATVERVEHTPGRFRAAFHDKASLDNERNAVVFRHGARRYLMVQIAGALARRIVCRVAPGDALVRGDRFGLIMFGSRMDVFVPPDVRPLVSAGDRVHAGLTPIAEEPA